MQVVILCGGLGTRLREETTFVPKPMVAVGEKPILWHIMKIYSHYGLNDFVLALGYKAEVIKQYFYFYDFMHSDVTIDLAKRGSIKFHGNKQALDWRVTMAETGLRTLKGGRLKRVEKYITGDTFLMTYGDGVSDIDIGKLVQFHRSHGRIATVSGVSATGRFGELRTDGDRVLSFMEKPSNATEFVNGGFFVFDRRIFDSLTDEEDCDLEIGPLERLAAEGQMMVYRHRGFWACMDTQRDADYLNTVWQRETAPWKVW